MARPTATGCFIYAGGFTRGMVDGGFSVGGHMENEKPYEADVAEHNLGVETFKRSEWGMPADVDVVYANPPCAPFSSTGYTSGKSGAKWVGDLRLQDHADAITYGKNAGAEIIALESVQAAALRGAAFYEKARPKGYALSFLYHEACWLGLPQRRKRVFIVYHQGKLDPLEPDEEQTVLEPALLRGCKSPEPAGGRVSLLSALRKTKPGEKLKVGWVRDGSRRGQVPSLMSARLKWGVPTPTLSGTYGYAHPDEDRFINVKEYQRLCGYPDDYKFFGSANRRVLAMTRAVMPPVAARLALTLKGSLQNPPVRKRDLNA